MMAFIPMIAAIIKWRPSGIRRCCRQLVVWGSIIRYTIRRAKIKMEELQAFLLGHKESFGSTKSLRTSSAA